MAHQVDIHQAQTAILRELLFHPNASFAQLREPTGLTSDHFNFHITRLLALGFVTKESRGRYKLSPKGKEFANRLDTDKNTVERQPKVAVILNVEKQLNGKRHYLFQERLKNPYYGFWGLPTGKITWGEKVIDTAERELLEETNLSADWEVAGIYHELAVIEESGELIEDKIFFICHGTNPKGKMLVDFEGGHNEWMTKEEALAKKSVFPNFELELEIMESDKWLHEHEMHYKVQDF